MVPRLSAAGKASTPSATLGSPRPAVRSQPRPLTLSELEWLRREGAEFQAEYLDIRSRVRGEFGVRAGRPRG